MWDTEATAAVSEPMAHFWTESCVTAPCQAISTAWDFYVGICAAGVAMTPFSSLHVNSGGHLIKTSYMQWLPIIRSAQARSYET